LRTWNAFQVRVKSVPKRVPKYVPKAEREGVNACVPGTRSRYVPKAFRNAFQKVFQKCSNVLERVPKSVPAFHSVPGTVLAVPERAVGSFKVYNSPNFSTDCTIMTGIDYEKQVESQERSSCHWRPIIFPRLLDFT